jgi:hypothetical protein
LQSGAPLEFGMFLPTADAWSAFDSFWDNQPESALWTNT